MAGLALSEAPPGGTSRSKLTWRRYRQVVLPILSLCLSIVAWEGVSKWYAKPYLLPTPLSVASYLGHHSHLLLTQSLNTLKVTFIGLALSIVVSVLLAILMVAFRSVREAIYPLVVATQIVPKVALAPLIVAIFGFGSTSKSLIAFLVAFFPLMMTTVQGLMSIDPSLIELMRVLRASPLTIMRKARLPNALPYFMDGVKISFTLSLIGAIVGEFQAGSEGLGYLLQTGIANLQAPLSYAALLVLTVEGLIFYWGLELITRLVVPWSPSAIADATRGEAS